MRNPIVSGFHPDPSVCVVGEDIYLVASTFAWFPGVPIWHSRDLANWRLVGNILDRPSQLPLTGSGINGGIWAPSIRHHAGRFYMITTNHENGGNFLVHAERPEGPWSEPVWLPIEGWDPSLDWDRHGICYLTCTRKGEMIHGCTIDLPSGRFTSPIRDLWDGQGYFGVEAPHLYHINDWYYLLVAAGAYQRGHLAAIARSRSPWGPFETCPGNPILTQRERMGAPIQCTGHGDLFQSGDGRWWLSYLAVRNYGGLANSWYTLGRESFVAPVTWDDQGWPVVAPPALDVPDARLPAHPWPASPERETFAVPPGPQWLNLRQEAAISVSERPGWLTVRGGLMARRVDQPWIRATARLEVQGGEGGLSLFTSDTARVDIVLTPGQVAVRRRFDDWRQDVATAALPPGPVEITVLGNPWAHQFTLLVDGVVVLEHKVQSRLLSTDLSGGCVGLTIGVFAQGDAVTALEWFDYRSWRSQNESGLNF